MAIQFYEHEDSKLFKLDTPNTSYLIQVADEEGFILHLYYGKRLASENIADLCRITEPLYLPSRNNRERSTFLDSAYFEYPSHGLGDFRDDAFSVLNPDGYSATSLSYKGYRIFAGKPGIKGLPATFGKDSECTTLEVTGTDEANGLEIVLSYTVFEDTDAIARSVRVKNTGKYDNVKLTRVLSSAIDLRGEDYDTIFLHGSWAREREIERTPISFGKHYVSSIRGESSHQEHPFIALAGHDANNECGEVYGFSFVYSGNFIAQAELSQMESVRVMMGINPVDFCWNLHAGEEFCTPEVICVYSDEGIGKMSRTFHDLFRNHLIRSEYKDKKRPILKIGRASCRERV